MKTKAVRGTKTKVLDSSMRKVVCQGRTIWYQLERKQVKNLNLRVKADGSVVVSAAPRCAAQRVDAFVLEKAAFIFRAKQRLEERREREQAAQQSCKEVTDAQCAEVFGALLEKWLPVFQGYGVPRPKLRIREMKTRWGSCLTQKGIVTLNRRLILMPYEAIEYVVVHELCHFLQPNHSAAFYALLEQQLPDYKKRRAQLRG